ncbi:MAG: DNA (cytosine-5-)-methyltransferase [Candidatus Micrarchaeaceae archaeon]
MRYFSAFAGVGGFEQGLPADWICVGQSEIDKYANMVLRYRFPNIKNYGDIREINWAEVPDFDVLFGGTPCQDLSVAGKRKGLAGERSRLFFEYIRALKAKKPKYFIWENVKGALSSNEGWDYLEVQNQFSEAGYSFQWQVLNAKYFGVPQNRERIFVVGHFGSECARKVFYQQENSGEASKLQSKPIQLNKNQSRAYRIYSPDGIAVNQASQAGGVGAKTGLYEVKSMHLLNLGMNGRRQKENGEPSFALNTLGEIGVSVNKQIRRLTPIECERLMGWADDWTRWGIDEKGNKVEISDAQRYRLIGNGVVSSIVKRLINDIMAKP